MGCLQVQMMLSVNSSGISLLSSADTLMQGLHCTWGQGQEALPTLLDHLVSLDGSINIPLTHCVIGPKKNWPDGPEPRDMKSNDGCWGDGVTW